MAKLIFIDRQIVYAEIQSLKLGTAHDTLKDETKRRAYDLIYPFITKRRLSSDTTQTPRAPPASTSKTEAISETAQIAALQKSKQERSARWFVKRNAFDSSIFALQRDIRQLEKEIKAFDTTVAAEVATNAQKNSWGTWLLSSIYKKAEDSEQEKARKDREMQEKRIAKDMKERRLRLRKVALKKEEGLLRKAKEEIGAADMVDDEKIRVIQHGIRVREILERRFRERQEEERRQKFRKQQQEQWEERERHAAAVWRKQQAEERAADQKRKEEYARIWQRRTGQASTSTCTSTCNHGSWWPKVQGRTACPECHDIWTYLLECPGCKMKACPKCQGAIRRRIGATRRATAKVGTSSPMLF